MEYNRTTPSADGYYMPAEYEPHKGCIMIWPQRPGSWKKDAKDAEQAFCAVMEAITKSEPVYLAAGKKRFFNPVRGRSGLHSGNRLKCQSPGFACDNSHNFFLCSVFFLL